MAQNAANADPGDQLVCVVHCLPLMPTKSNSGSKQIMERLADCAFTEAFRRYLHQGGEGAKLALRRTIPRRGEWFLCEVDGQDYAVRVMPNGRIEFMENIFDRVNGNAKTDDLNRELPLPLF